MLERLDIPIFIDGCSGHRKGQHKFRNLGNYTVECVRCDTAGAVVPADQAAEMLDDTARRYLNITPEDVATEIEGGGDEHPR
ncbi:hypothetical protein [Streptomyces sp. NRRL S-920]|uniref:hypothetical protein n=1 Tax=Streptomyces sp. NRRL S-920 TaxID=1463921 RepID=UPI0004C8A91D|nr:hypothetical protein [Streptomyces sp. NRRL S-920]